VEFTNLKYLRFAIPVLAGALLLGIAASSFISNNLPEIVAYADANGLTPNPPKPQAATQKSLAQKSMQKSFAARQKAEMKAFQKAQKARDKALLKPQEKAINHNKDISPNQKKAMIKSLTNQQKAIDKAETADFKAQQKAARTQNNAYIKALIKQMYG
jgi:hypothetical protein